MKVNVYFPKTLEIPQIPEIQMAKALWLPFVCVSLLACVKVQRVLFQYVKRRPFCLLRIRVSPLPEGENGFLFFTSQEIRFWKRQFHNCNVVVVAYEKLTTKAILLEIVVRRRFSSQTL